MEALFKKWFSVKLSPKRIDRCCRQLITGKNTAPDADNSTQVRVACVQRPVCLVRNVEQYIDMLYGFIRQAAEEKCRLIVFPEYNFFDLFGLIPGFRVANRCLNHHIQQKKRKLEKGLQEKKGRTETHPVGNDREKAVSRGDGYFISTVFKGISEPVEKGINKIISIMAEGFGIYIYTGSYMLKEGGAYYNAGSLFGPDGSCLGTQKKIHLTDFEVGMGLSRGREIKLYSLPFGNFVFPVCMDATYFETFRISREIGGDIAVLPIANMEEYNVWRALRGIWPRVQESYMYGLKASLNGWVAGMHFTGRAGIFAPLEITPDYDGVINLAPHYEGNYLVTGDLDLEKLCHARENARYHGDSNPGLEEEYVSKIYDV
jgi:predicted amidohydrolase